MKPQLLHNTVIQIMAKSILRCFHFSSCDSHISTGQISSKDLDAFYYSYSKDLSQLSKSFSHGSISLSWSVEAIKILKKMQVGLLILVKKSSLPISIVTEDDNWLDQYMKGTITMLDFCSSLKCAVSRVDRYRMMVDIMINNLNRNYSADAVEFESMKCSDLSIVKEAVRQYEGIGAEDKNTNSVRVVVSVLLHSAVICPVSVELGGCDLAYRYPQLKPFIDMLSMLVREFNDREHSSESELIEHANVGRVMVDIQAQMVDGVEDKERFLSSLELLRTSSVELKEGIEKLDAAVDDVFDVVIRGRNEMLGVLRHRDFYLLGEKF